MSNDKATAVAKVRAQEDGIRDIYRSVFNVLTGIDRSEFSREKLAMLDSSLDSPEKIGFEKLVAVLKAVMGSTDEDKLHLESNRHSIGGRSASDFVKAELKELGLGYSEFYDFVHEKGWARQGGWTQPE